jgi:citrate lyase subunit beta/citryl-CoA lyase
MRSLLFIPADSEKKLVKGLSTPADCLILDLEDSVTPANKDAARRIAVSFLETAAAEQCAKQLFVRINALQSGMAIEDLVTVLPAHPDGIVLPKCRSGEDVTQVHHYLDALEIAYRREKSPARILPIITEVAAALFALATYKNASDRLWGLMWGAEDLATELGALDNRADGQLRPPFELARSLCLYAAAHAGVVAVDTVSPTIADAQSLAKETVAAKRDGFTAKAAIHPLQVPVINEQLSPSSDEIAWATRVIAAFDASGGAGTISLDGKMLDRPHWKVARRILGPP